MKMAAFYSRALREAFGDAQPVHEAPGGREAQECLLARGDSLLDEGDEAALKSVLPGVADDCWTQFVRNMIVAPVSAVSDSNAVGMFEMMPRRLADLGVVSKLARTRSDANKTIWVAAFVPPLTADKFLSDQREQYRVFSDSMCDYAKRMENGEIARVPGMSLSGALAILHRCGPTGLATWERGERFPATVKSYERVAGLF